MSLMIFLLSSFGVTGLLLRSAVDSAMTKTRQSLKGAFRVAPDMQNSDNVEVDQEEGQTSIRYVGKPLNEEVAEAIRRSQNIDNYDIVIKREAMLPNHISLVDYNGKYLEDPVAMHLVSVEAHTEGRYAGDFQKERLRLTEGGLGTGDDQYAAVISTKLALQNQLEIGDEIGISPQEGFAGREIRVTVKGLFTVEEKQQDTDVAAPVFLLENRIFIDSTSAGVMAGETGADYIDFFVEDPAHVPAMIEEIQNLEEIDWKSFAVTAHIEEYEKIADSLGDMSVLSDTLLIISVALSTVVLSLTQILFHRSREHETGILLSIGISKAEIVQQHFMEMAMTSLAPFVVSFVFCILEFSFYMAALNIEGTMDMGLALSAMLLTFGWGSTVLLVSVLLSNLWLMRFQPKRIFSKLS